jgi:hypothetical protein
MTAQFLRIHVAGYTPRSARRRRAQLVALRLALVTLILQADPLPMMNW